MGSLYDVGKGRERVGDARERAKQNGLLSSPSFLSLRMRTSSAPVATTAQHSRSPPPALTTTAHARAPLLAGRRAIGPGPRHHCSGHTDKSPWTRAPSQILAIVLQEKICCNLRTLNLSAGTSFNHSDALVREGARALRRRGKDERKYARRQKAKRQGKKATTGLPFLDLSTRCTGTAVLKLVLVLKFTNLLP